MRVCQFRHPGYEGGKFYRLLSFSLANFLESLAYLSGQQHFDVTAR